MSNETPQPPENDGALDLSGLNFGPAWARDPAESKSLKKFKNRGDRDDRRGGGGRRDDRWGGGGPRRDNRGGGGGGGRGPRDGGRGRRDDDRRPPRREVEPPEGFKMSLMPAEESLDLLAKRVIDSGQTFSVFDLAKVLLQSRDRFRVTFESSEKVFYRCREDQSIWLTKDEARSHLWRSDWVKKFYEEVQVEGEAPKGSFSAISRCGISNELLGPPNYHGYQEKLTALHRERFSNMSIDAYKAKVRTEHGEEVVEAWLESMKTVTKWKVAEPKEEEPKADDLEAKEVTEESADPASEPEAAPEAAAPDQSEEPAAAEETPAAEESPAEEESEPAVEESSAEDSEAKEEEPVAEEGAPEIEEPAPAEEKPVELFDDARAVERHFAENHFEEVFEETNRAWVMGDIRGNLLSPGLLTLLKQGVAEEKRYPASLMPVVCRQLSGRHVAVFKWKKKLKVGPSRPHAVPTETPLAERPRAMIDHLLKNSGVALKDFWGAVMPSDVTDEQKHDWFQDFQWLLSQGHIILLSDTTVHLAKRGEVEGPPAKKAAAKKAPAKKKAKPEAEKAKAPEDPTPAPAPVVEDAKEAEKGSKPEETSEEA
ncbi:hypothetical protein OAE38_00605 [Akkermansiaceae bacterium]|nr:hypothetical protein [bacterium]MDB4646990.1 hypothetical protein [Akkermansiaceae bacterium]